MRGSCGCHSCTWSSTTPPQHLDFCYCTQCQQLTGSAFGAWMGMTRSSLTLSGPIRSIRLSITNIGENVDDATRAPSEIATRTFCSQCGGTLSIQYDCYPGKTHVTAGTIVLGADRVPKVGCHLFVAEKQPWYGMREDGVKRWQGFDDEFLDVVKEWESKQGE